MLRVNTRIETQGDRTGGEERLNSKHSALTKITSVTVGVNSEGPPGSVRIMCITLGNPGWLDPMSARSHIGPGETRLMYGHLPSFVRGRFLPSCYNCTKTSRIE